MAQAWCTLPTACWTLYSAGGDDRWHRYDFARPGSDVVPLLAAIDDDITRLFRADAQPRDAGGQVLAPAALQILGRLRYEISEAGPRGVVEESVA